MNKYVSPIIEIEYVEVEDIVCTDERGENETGGLGGLIPVNPSNPGGGTPGGGEVELPVIPNSLNQYFNA